MTFWQFLDKLLDRMPGWPDGRGLVGTATFVLTLIVLTMMIAEPSLLKDDFFKTIATLIVGGFIKDVVGWGFATNAREAEIRKARATGKPNDPVNVKEA